MREYGVWGTGEQRVTLHTQRVGLHWSVRVLDRFGRLVATYGGFATERAAVGHATVRTVLYGYTVTRPVLCAPRRRRPARKAVK